MNLTKARLKAQLTREEAAVKLGIASSTLRAWEKGINGIPSLALPRLQELLGLSDSEILNIIKLQTKEAS